MESIYPAVRMGADAVYLGAEQFSARAGAQNFSRQELKEAVEYCHIRNVRVYLAVNTLLRDPELKTALSLAEYAASLPVDGFIVQDVGFASLLREAAPKIRLHASTQMSVHTPAGAAALYDAGFSRVVLSRELSLEEIKEIHNASPIELEVFVHGALCMSVSGQCYFSAMLGSRSGNRGQCAQPCRLPFSVEGGTGYDLSLKDYSIVSRLKELEAAGVASAKIEGRMKRPEYVAAATAVCRYAADGKEIPEELAQKLRSGQSPDEKREALLHTMACKAAIKGGWTSDPAELRALVDRVQSGEVKYCPHGRPVAAKITKYELEKLFKRA